jgi:hypothetical protein
VVSAFAVQVPVTLSEPESFTSLQAFGSRPTVETSKTPPTLKHDELTFQVPTTSPPHAGTLEQEPPAPPVLLVLPPAPTMPPVLDTPPLPVVPPVLLAVPPLAGTPPFPGLPPVGVGLLGVELHEALETKPSAIAIVRPADWTFIEVSFKK